MSGPWREPAEESVDLYPGLVVCDNRVTGSITVGQSRLPLWAFTSWSVTAGWDEIESAYSPGEYGWKADDQATFLGSLLEMRGEFARLLLMLADAERREHVRGAQRSAWWDKKAPSKRIAVQLRRCLAVLEGET